MKRMLQRERKETRKERETGCNREWRKERAKERKERRHIYRTEINKKAEKEKMNEREGTARQSVK